MTVTDRPPHDFTTDLVPCPHVTEHAVGVLIHPLAGDLFGISGILTAVDCAVVVGGVDVVVVVCVVRVVAVVVEVDVEVDVLAVAVSVVVVVVAPVVVVVAAAVVVVVAAVVVVGHYKS